MAKARPALSVRGWLLGSCSARLGSAVPSDKAALAEAITFALWSQRASQFWVGDLFVRAEELFGDQIYDELEGDDWSIERIDMWVGVARKVPAERRRKELSWSHHAAVAKLPVVWQKKMLQDAVDGRWTSVELRKQVSIVASRLKSGLIREVCDGNG